MLPYVSVRLEEGKSAECFQAGLAGGESCLDSKIGLFVFTFLRDYSNMA